jgi:hypothetical protein
MSNTTENICLSIQFSIRLLTSMAISNIRWSHPSLLCEVKESRNIFIAFSYAPLCQLSSVLFQNNDLAWSKEHLILLAKQKIICHYKRSRHSAMRSVISVLLKLYSVKLVMLWCFLQLSLKMMSGIDSWAINAIAQFLFSGSCFTDVKCQCAQCLIIICHAYCQDCMLQ